jgi:hypothetical protein
MARSIALEKLVVACMLAHLSTISAAPLAVSHPSVETSPSFSLAAYDAETARRGSGTRRSPDPTETPTHKGGNPTRCWNYNYVAGAYAFGIVFQGTFAAIMYYYTHRGRSIPYRFSCSIRRGMQPMTSNLFAFYLVRLRM